MKTTRSILVIITSLAVSPLDVVAATFTVTITNDAGAGSLRQAILDANSDAFADTIEFAISTPTKTIVLSNALPDATAPVTINGATQPGYVNAPLVELSGQSAGAGVDGLRINASNSVVRALVINRFTRDGVVILGPGNVIEGCYIGLSLAGTVDQGNTANGVVISNVPGNRVGGVTGTQRNAIAGNNANGVFIFGLNATNNSVQGNYIGLNAAGTAGVPNGVNGVLVSNAPMNTVGGTAAGSRNVISGNSQSGVRLENTNAFANLVAGNYIGQDFTGTTNRGNSQNGVYLFNAPSNTVGGVTAAARNLISGNGSSGVRIDGASARANQIVGNYIGTDVSGVLDRANGAEGVAIVNNGRDNLIGTTNAGAANIIAFNDNDGVGVATGTNNTIRGNSIYSNGNANNEIGIDIGASGVTPNDAAGGDNDSGANNLQNFPVLSSANYAAGTITIMGSLNSLPSSAYALDFYANQLADASGNGQGQFYLGSTNVTTGANSNANVTAVFTVTLNGRYVSATATDTNGNTSEFSPCVRAESSATPITRTVINTNDSGAGSLRQALLDVNSAPASGVHTVNFNIPGAGVRRITPLTALPPVIEPVNIDGFTQTGSSSNTLVNGNNAVWLIRLHGVSAGAGNDGLKFLSSSNRVSGLIITAFGSDGIDLTDCNNNVIVGNCIGLDEGGTNQGNGADGVFALNSSGNIIGGTAPSDRNIISGNGSDGVELQGANSRGNQILGNFLGTGPAGTNDVGNTQNGVRLNAVSANTVGGAAPGAGNLISGNNADGVELDGNVTVANFVFGNRIGTDVSGASGIPNGAYGVWLHSFARSNFIGGVASGEGNTIAFNNSSGVYVQGTPGQLSTNNAVRGNSIFLNGQFGLDLDPPGVQTNDFGDADTGANHLQNYPVITNALLNVSSVLIEGTLNSRPSSTYLLDFYASFVRDAITTNGEGQTYVGTIAVATGGDSNAAFSVTFPVTVTTGRWITATATDTNNNTSEFSTAFKSPSTRPIVTLTVTNTLNSGLGSFRQAILDNNTNFTSGNNLIRFQIPGAGVQTILPPTQLPNITESVTIDGYTQPGTSTNTLAAGDNAVIKIMFAGTNAPNNTDCLRLDADGCIVRGLSIIGFQGPSHYGIQVNSASNVIEGNFIGIDTTGTNMLGDTIGVFVNTSDYNLIGGISPGARNVFGGNSIGVLLYLGASGNTVQGNFIGTDASGTLDKGNTSFGVRIDRAYGNLIGGNTSAARNIISGNSLEGVRFEGDAATNQVLNNYIGTDVTGTQNLGNGSHGVSIGTTTPSGNLIGSPGAGNIIAFNNGDGVFVQLGTNHSIRANSIYSNGGLTVGNLGIDLGTSGVLTNDFPDLATGVNLQQNFPVITNAVADPASTLIQGRLTSRASTTYQVDFFSSLVGDPSGCGEGQKWLGTTNVMTDGSSNATFNVTLPTVALGRYISATATDPSGNTSEFATNYLAASTIPPLTFVVTNINDSGPGSLRQAILNNNDAVSSTNNTITFAIPGAGPHVILPVSQLPVPTERVTIDGYTQAGASANTLTNGDNAVLKIRLDGASALFGTTGLPLTGVGGNVVRGLSLTDWGSAIEMGATGNNRIEGNFIGLQTDGLTIGGNFNYGVLANNSPGNVIGGTTPAARNVISGNNTHGVFLSGTGSLNNRVEGNFLGTDFSGTLDRGNGQRGVAIDNASTNTIGGTTAAARNIISGNNFYGINLTGTSQGNLIQGNFIGSDVTGTAPAANSFAGIVIGLSTSSGTGGNLIGGTNAGAGNLIVYNTGTGVSVLSGTNNPVRGNSILLNTGLGIDLASDAVVTPNDAGDPDTGGNQLQNFPVLSAATITPVNTMIQGSLNSAPGAAFEIDFYANVFPDPTFTAGEGQQYLGSTSVTTAANSNANFNVTLPTVALGRYITATATDPSGNTSEFATNFVAASTFAPLTFVVTNTLDSGPGSLRQAMLNNNTTPSASNNVITFNIPGAGPHTIAPTSALPVIVESVIIDGFTEPGSVSNTLANGNNAVWMIQLTGSAAGAGSEGLVFNSPSNVARGLVINGFPGNGIDLTTPGNRIVGNVIGLHLTNSILANQGYGIFVTGVGNRIGGTAPSDRNVISGNSIYGVLLNGPGAMNNRVEGNFIGTDISGTLDRGNFSHGILVSGPSNFIGGAVSGAGNVISGNTFTGVFLSQASGTTIQGNFIGIDATGTAYLGNSQNGVVIQQSTNVLVGGTGAPARNVISGNPLYGVNVATLSEQTRIVGNYIGTDLTGTLSLGNGHGVEINANSTTVGGVAAGEANVIAFNFSPGVSVSSGTNNSVRANSIYSSGDLGIHLGGFSGVLSNDIPDVATGANLQQNYPVITNAIANVANTVVQGVLPSRTGVTYQLDFYINDAGDSSGFGEGQRWLGSTNVTTDGAGNANFNFIGAAFISGRNITATATDPNGNTSEFSQGVNAGTTIPPGTFIVINTNNSGAGSLRQALLNVSLLPNTGNDLIQFAIPGAGVRTIMPLSQLPTPIDPVTIDGYTQTNSSPNTLTNGNNAVILIRLHGTNAPIGDLGLNLTNGNNIIRGLEIAGFKANGINLNAGRSNVVTGNIIWSNSVNGVFIDGGSGSRIGGLTPDARNVISANGGYGIRIQGTSASNNVVQGNFLGTDFTGTAARGNNSGGLLVDSGSGNLIGPTGAGGGATVMRNVISGNTGVGIGMAINFGTPVGNRIFGNLIGTDVMGTSALGNQSVGISVSGGVGTIIGGTNANEPNLVAFSGSRGIQVLSVGATNNDIRANSIYDNNALGIDLGGNNVTENDLAGGDADGGPNLQQNFPLLTNALLTTSNLIVQGSLNSQPSTAFRLDFYANVICDPTGNGEGKHWLGSTTATTGVDSNATFNVGVAAPVEGSLITATATDPAGNTSEFCDCRQMISVIPPLDLVVVNTNDSGPGSLRAAINTNNSSFTSSNNLIRFNIAGGGVKRIMPLTQLPTVTRPVVINGFSQPGAQPDTVPGETNNAVWLIVLDGSNAGTGEVDGLHLTSSSNIILGLVIVNFDDDGIELENGSGSLIDGCLIGIDVNASGSPTVVGSEVKSAGMTGSPVAKGSTPGNVNTAVHVNNSSDNEVGSGNYTGNTKGPAVKIKGNSNDSRIHGKHGKDRDRDPHPIGGPAVENDAQGTKFDGEAYNTAGPVVQSSPTVFDNGIDPERFHNTGNPPIQRGTGTEPNNPPFAYPENIQAVNSGGQTIIDATYKGLSGNSATITTYAREPGDIFRRVDQRSITVGASGNGTVHIVRTPALAAGTEVILTGRITFIGTSQSSPPTTVQGGTPPPMDFGDAPNSYHTLLSAIGAGHVIVNNVWLGARVDAEADGQPTNPANGDDANGVLDDEDGVILLTPLVAGSMAQVHVTAAAPGKLDFWIDYNRDGDFDLAGSNPDEFVPNGIAGHPGGSVILAAGTTNIQFTVPNNASVGSSYARFRFSSAGNLQPTGSAPNGEVEDYQVQLLAGLPDFGDAPGLPNNPRYPTLLVHNGAFHGTGIANFRLGAQLDVESDGQPEAKAKGDDNAGSPDDEDGVTFVTSLEPGGNATINVMVSVPGNLPAGGKLDAWVDFNFDSDWLDAGEQILTSVTVANGLNVLQFPVPAGAGIGQTFARFRLSDLGGLQPDGGSSNGEVEDYMVAVGPNINSIAKESGQLTIRWTGNHALYGAPTPTGPWMKLTSTSPYPIDTTQSPKQFYGLGPP